MLEVLAVIAGAILIGSTLLDAFETIVLPRRITRQVRLARVFFRLTWQPWAAVSRGLRSTWRETFLSFYGPLSLIVLIILWAATMVLGFALVSWGAGSVVDASGHEAGFGTNLYDSGTTFFTLGLGDFTPNSTLSRVLAVVETASGFGFLALVITYLPVLYQSFSRREINVTLLDARAGSPPSAGELFARLDGSDMADQVTSLMIEWERWAAELLETHLSYPILTLYRSQHERQSWLAALTAILDTAALVISLGPECASYRPARLTFAMARHAAVDLSQVLRTQPQVLEDRLPSQDFEKLVAVSPFLANARSEKLHELRLLYEPNVCALSSFLLMPLAGWLPTGSKDAWQSSPWGE